MKKLLVVFFVVLVVCVGCVKEEKVTVIDDKIFPEEMEDDLDKDDESWRSYLDDDDPEDLGIDIPDEEFDDVEEEEEEEEEYAEEEFEYVSADDYVGDDDDDDDDDEDDDF